MSDTKDSGREHIRTASRLGGARTKILECPTTEEKVESDFQRFDYCPFCGEPLRSDEPRFGHLVGSEDMENRRQLHTDR